MGLSLGVPHEALSLFNKKTNKQVEYCTLDPLVYFDIGFKTGVPLGRITVKLSRSAHPTLTDHVIKLCVGQEDGGVTGKPLSFTGTQIYAIDKNHGILMAGDVLNGNGTNCTPHLGAMEVRETRPSIPLSKGGNFVMLPVVHDSTLFSSHFYFHIGPAKEIYDGTVIGQIVEGRDMLEQLMDFGTASGVPTQPIYIHKSGQH